MKESNSGDCLGETRELGTEEEPEPRSAKMTKSAAAKLQKKEAAERKKAERLASKMAAEAEKKRKKELDEANRKKSSRSSCAKEIIIKFGKDFAKSELGSVIKQQSEELGCDIKEVDRAEESENGIYYSITFDRKVTNRFDPEQDMYVPIPLEIKPENVVVIYMEGKKAVDIFLNTDKKKQHLETIDAAYREYQVLYIIEGLHAQLKKADLELDKKFADRVRQLVAGQATAVEATTNIISDRPSKIAWDSLIELEITKNCRLCHTKSREESAEMILGFAMDIGSRHYKARELLASETLDMIGTVRSGTSIQDTLSKSLEQIKYVTPVVSKSVASVYNNMFGLMESIDKRGTEALEGLRKESGTRSTKVVGSSLAKSICKILQSKDPDQYLQL
ncbi:hypothetical protein AWJ20_405 [Sugiyamaella lignohabitans]|uniref:Uncharacterized protein n=1 Tax=Sugiyamaella lignohabitans TaxID=796027 RepID=A0A161HIA9_9ASCO|nr:uncharacterized protein AWJ20_405 [Sugiyamaella lignohabitans]ANB12167.1 hypothetical protein AWJ20_405 [Sugiyamaella lignohabitans]